MSNANLTMEKQSEVRQEYQAKVIACRTCGNHPWFPPLGTDVCTRCGGTKEEWIYGEEAKSFRVKNNSVEEVSDVRRDSASS